MPVPRIIQGFYEYSQIRRLYQAGCLACMSLPQVENLKELEIDREKFNSARRELQIDPWWLIIQVYEAKDMPSSVRGQVNAVRPRIYHIYLNPQNAADDTVLHELYHIHQILYGSISQKEIDEIEEAAQEWAERQLRQGKFAGVLK